ncbi:MAG: TetR-like C-terminal domain-containing protein [Eubacteriales bacterium]|nr:TetR-like C-terminal domain-containing protein [Eubacteriales bacterium]
MAVPNNRRTILTKRILKETLIELMQNKPITKITIKEICEMADLSRSTFYLHYTDQFALLEDIENEVLHKTFDYLTEMNTETDSVASIEIFLDYVKSNRSTFGILLCQPENTAFQQNVTKALFSYLQNLVPSLKDGKQDSYLYTFMIHGSIHVIIDWIGRNFDVPAHDLAKLIFQACV